MRNRIRFYQAKLNVSSKEIRGKIVSLLFFKKYEQEEAQMITDYMRTDLPVVDLGSSIGAISSNAALLSSSRVLCVEANPNLIDVIESNLTENAIPKNRVEVSNYAICDRKNSGSALYFTQRGSNELGRLCEASTEGAIQVKSIALSDLLRENQIGEYVLISDIEGAEVAFLFDDAECLKDCEQLFIELHEVEWDGRLYTVDILVNRILSLGFERVLQDNTNFYFRRNARS